jgi:hypothetical protein
LGFNTRALLIYEICASSLLLCAAPTFALDPQRLWLPTRYQTLYLPLVKAAETAEALDRCVTVMEGTIDLEQSRPEHPIYRILCRQDSGRTYNEMVDGLTFVTLTTQQIAAPELTPDEQELQRLQEEERRLAEIARYKTEAWETCRQGLLQSTRLMLELRWLVDLESVEPESFSDEIARFVVGFDASSMQGEALHFTGECTYSAGAAEVQLRKR